MSDWSNTFINQNCLANKIFIFVCLTKQCHISTFLLAKTQHEAKSPFLGCFTSIPLFEGRKIENLFSSFQRSKMRFLLEKQFFISFLLKPFSFSHMAWSSLITVQKMSVFCLNFHFLRVADGILHKFDGCEESAVKLISEVETHSHWNLLKRF